MSVREQILGRVRSALGDRQVATAPPPRIVVPQIDFEQRATQFLYALEKLSVKSYCAVSLQDACGYAQTVLAGRTAVASNSPLLVRCGIEKIPGVARGFHSAADVRAACASAGMGITAADYVLADTGTLVMLSSQDEARMISLVPPAHLAIVPRERLLSGLDELFTLVPKPAALSSSMVFITGPSRTADIEQILVRGVHGPGEVHVVLL